MCCIKWRGKEGKVREGRVAMSCGNAAQCKDERGYTTGHFLKNIKGCEEGGGA